MFDFGSLELSTILSFTLTLLVFSYLLRDNVLYRLTIAVFVGIAAAFTTIVIVEGVLLPLEAPLTEFSGVDLLTYIVLYLGVPAVLTLLLLLKPLPAFKSLSNIALAYLIAVGTAAAIVGAIAGTLIPLTAQTVRTGTDVIGIINTVIVVIGVVTSLLYFQYTARQTVDGTTERPASVKWLARIGEGFIVVTLGAVYSAAILTSLTILTGQLSTLFGT